MPGTPTTRYAIPTLAGTTLARDIDTETNAALSAIDSKMVGYSSGTLASRPISTVGTPGIAGRRYRATDTGQEFTDTGTSWVEVATGYRAKSVIATEEARTNAAYGLLSTPDRVQNIVVPTDGIVRVRYHAMWKESAADVARAAIFIGTDQLKIWSGDTNKTAPTQQAAKASLLAGGNPTAYRLLTTYPLGLYSTEEVNAAGYSGDVTTGQALGQLTGQGSTFFIDDAGGTGSGSVVLQHGGAVDIFGLAAGSYDISVQFKTASGGTVTAKNRRLLVEVVSFG